MSGHTAERWSGKEWAVRLVILTAGLVIAHLGVTLFLLSRLGADPFNVFVQGVFVKAGPLLPEDFLTHGRTHIALSLCIIAVLLIVDRSYIKAGTLICMTCGGPIIDFFTWLLIFLLPEDLPFPGRLVMLVLGCLILAYGMTIVITSKAGTGPNDLVAVVIADKTRRKFGIVRLLVDLAFALTGFALGGILGIGTVVCTALVGPVAGIFMPLNEKQVTALVQRLR